MGNKNKQLKMIVLILIFIGVLVNPVNAMATEMNVTADSTKVNVEELVTITITVSGEQLAVANGAFTYDPNMLSYISGRGGVADGHINMISAEEGGSNSLTAVIQFAAIKTGSAEVRVTLDDILSYDEKKVDNVEAGVNITINGAGDSGSSESNKFVANLAKTGVKAENVMGSEEPMYIWRSLESLTLPSGFSDRQTTYNGEYVGGVAVEDDEEFILLYLSKENGENAGYYVYNEKTKTLFPYLTMTSISAYYTLLWPDEAVELSEIYDETILEWKGKEVPAWQMDEWDEAVFLIYARKPSGEKGFFVYNSEEKSVQRLNALPEMEQKEDNSPVKNEKNEPISKEKNPMNIALVIVLCVVCVILIGVIVVFVQMYNKVTEDKRRAERKAERLQKSIFNEDNIQ